MKLKIFLLGSFLAVARFIGKNNSNTVHFETHNIADKYVDFNPIVAIFQI